MGLAMIIPAVVAIGTSTAAVGVGVSGAVAGTVAGAVCGSGHCRNRRGEPAREVVRAYLAQDHVQELLYKLDSIEVFDPASVKDIAKPNIEVVDQATGAATISFAGSDATGNATDMFATGQGFLPNGTFVTELPDPVNREVTGKWIAVERSVSVSERDIASAEVAQAAQLNSISDAVNVVANSVGVEVKDEEELAAKVNRVFEMVFTS